MRYLFALSSNRSNKNFKRLAPVVLYCQSTSYVTSVKPSGIVLINRVRDCFSKRTLKQFFTARWIEIYPLSAEILVFSEGSDSITRNSDPSSSKLWHQATVLAGTTAETMAQSSKTLLPAPTLIVKLQSLRAHAISAQISVAASFYHVLCHAISVLILEV
ncbi:hypothetical protein Peur_039806 [Populus x canadensis]